MPMQWRGRYHALIARSVTTSRSEGSPKTYGHGETNSPRAFLVRSTFKTRRLAALQYPTALCHKPTYGDSEGLIGYLLRTI
jgi:hypothetical protein